MQVLRTVSTGPFGRDIRRDDVWQGYFRMIGRATKLLYLENQYFHEPLLAAAIVKQAHVEKDLQVMVVVSTGTDDTGPGVDQAQLDWVANSRALRFEFFQELAAIPKDRLRVYTIFYPGGLLHSKLILADDQVLSIGSANANPRGFFFDSEINVTIEDPKLVKEFRHRLWAHNLGMSEAVVSRWRDQDFFQMWDVIAGQNAIHDLPQATPPDKVRSATIKMFGDMVLPFATLDKNDPRFDRGKKGKITMPFPLPDLSPQRAWF
jgi:phosphatidylserine/phosphatidylglycerophosphate/cardiolipin synthase-like enzyme